MLVTIAGTITMASACAGGMVTASRPIDTVGRPSPITPLTKSGEQEGRGDENEERLEHAATLTDRRNRHNLEITEPAFGHDEGWVPMETPCASTWLTCSYSSRSPISRSITRGALQSHLALASASARIKGLEEALGVTLLKRGRRGIELTVAGESLLDHARIVMHQVDAMRGDLAVYASGTKASVHLLANTSVLSEHLPKALASFLREHPDINVDVEERESSDIAAAIAGGVADLGFAVEQALPDHFERFRFGEDRLVLVAGRRGEFAGRRQIDFADVLASDFVGLTSPTALQGHIAKHAARLGGGCGFGRGCGISMRSARWWRQASALPWCRKPPRDDAPARCLSP